MGHIFLIHFLPNDEKTWSKHSHGDFASNPDTFTCRLSKRVLRQRFLQSGVTKFLIVCNFGNTLAMTIIFFFKISKIWCRFQKWNKNWENVFLLSDACIWIGTLSHFDYLSVFRNSASYRVVWKSFSQSVISESH